MLDGKGRELTLQAIREVCEFRGWSLLAAHVRSNHVHVVVEADVEPERVMNDFKTFCEPGVEFRCREGAKALGAAWEYAVAVEGSGCAGRDSVCGG